MSNQAIKNDDPRGNKSLINNYKDVVSNSYQSITVDNINSVLDQLCEYADKIDKSVLEFMYQDFLNMYKSCRWTQKGVFENRKNIIAGLLDYCYSNNMCTEQYLSEFKGIYGSVFDNSVLFKTDYYKDFNELSHLINSLFGDAEDKENNMQAIGAIYMLWCGLTLDDICALKNEDLIDKKHIYIESTNRIIEIPENEISEVISYLKEQKDYVKKVRAKGSVGKMQKGNMEYDYQIVEYPNQDVIFKSTAKSTDGTCNPNKLRTLISTFNKKTNDLDITSELYGKVIRGNAIYKNGTFARLKSAEDTYKIKIDKWSINLIEELDKVMNDEFLNKQEMNNTTITRTTKMIHSYLQWRKVYYGY